MRVRLLPFVCTIVFADTMLFAAIVPLVPVLSDEFDLSKLQAGLLVGAYGAGAVAGGIPSGFLAERIGPRRTVVIGLVLLAAASAGFALADGAVTLGLARLGQGFASAVTWSGALAWLTLSTPRERRGQTLGTAFGFAVLGFIVGPVVGALAELTSVRGVFLAVAAATVGLVALAPGLHGHGTTTHSSTPLRRALRSVPFVAAVWLTVIPALFFGVLDLLAPLRFADAGWGSVAIAIAFVLAGLIEVALAPVAGRVSDQRGRLVPARIGLWGLVATAVGLALVDDALAVAVLLLASAVAVSAISTPGIALVSDQAEAQGLPQGLGFGVMNSAWAFGAMVGPIGAGALAGAIGDAAPYTVCAVLVGATVMTLASAETRPVRA